MVRAHGVHLGQTDMNPAEARAIVGPDVLIGLSTHTISQVEAASTDTVDYLGFGPIFGTSSKAEAGLPRGPALLAQAVQAADVPVVAIGGNESYFQRKLAQHSCLVHSVSLAIPGST